VVMVAEKQADVAVPLGMCIVAAIWYTDMFVGTPLEHLQSETIATFPHRLSYATIAVRELELPSFGVKHDLYHASLEPTTLVPENVSFCGFCVCGVICNYRPRYLLQLNAFCAPLLQKLSRLSLRFIWGQIPGHCT
jgi:hypothetical protein